MEQIYDKLADILEVDEVNPDDVLRDFDIWDSLTFLSIIVMLDHDYGINMVVTELAPIITAVDLVGLVQSKAK